MHIARVLLAVTTLGARWQDTANKTVSTGREGADNWLVQAKVGVAF